MKRRTSWWGSLGVGAKLILIQSVFVLAIVAVVLITTSALDTQRSAAGRANVAGWLRTLNQQHFKEVLMFRQGFGADYPQTREALLETVRLLREGGTLNVALDLQGSFGPADSTAVLTEISRLEELLPDMFVEADALLAIPPGQPGEAAQVQRLETASQAVTEANRRLNSAVVGASAQALDEIIRLQWLLTLVAIGLGTLLAWSLSRSILGPLADCVAVAEQIGTGNLGVAPVDVMTGDEVGQLGDTFNAMRDNLRSLLGGLSEAVETLGVSCSQILAATQEQASGASQQAASIQETTSTMEEVEQTGNQIAERSRQVAAEAEATSVASSVGIEGVRQAARAMESIRRQVEAVAENVVVLSEKNQAVGEVITVVKDIAERSNLLALNAAIEAAAAGEGGRSFSVVAAEMKNLADQSREATVTVRRILEEIQRGINTSVMLTEEAVKRVEAGKQHAEQAETTIHELNERVEDSVQAFQQITAATNQQQIGYEQVAQALRNIEMATEQTVAANRQLEASVVAINELSSRLRQATESYRL